MENLIIRTDNVFKSTSLNTATTDLANCFANIERNRKDACIVLATVEKGKYYKEDGFKSLAEYAERIGLDKSLAHKMENAGRLYISDNKAISEFAASADYSKLAILASADEKDLEEAIESGDIDADSTQDEIRSWKATKNAQKAPTKVLPKFAVTLHMGAKLKSYDAIELENVPELDGFTKAANVKRGEDAIPCAVYVNVSTLASIVVEYERVKEAPKPKKGKAVMDVKNFTDEQLKALMEEYARRQAEGK